MPSTNRGAAAVNMKFAGASYTDISNELELASPKQARRLVETELAAHVTEDNREAMRADLSARLYKLAEGVWPKATDPDHPEQIAAVRTAVTVLDRFAKLHGLDAPTELIVHSPTETELEMWVTAMVQTTLPAIEEAEVVAL